MARGHKAMRKAILQRGFDLNASAGEDGMLLLGWGNNVAPPKNTGASQSWVLMRNLKDAYNYVMWHLGVVPRRTK